MADLIKSDFNVKMRSWRRNGLAIYGRKIRIKRLGVLVQVRGLSSRKEHQSDLLQQRQVKIEVLVVKALTVAR